ncbi:MAG: 2-dehydropantoate 2-reductase [Sulfurimonas sp.]|nr:MAG: 2-dehydropantoate 2-reductase [Sulfurimonas sp.]
MRVAVVGLGGVGGYLAAALSKSSHEIVGFARGENLVKIRQNGIKIIEDDKEWCAEIEATTIDKVHGYFDIVLFCVKSYDLEESCKAISLHVDNDSVLLSFSNGVSNADLLRGIADLKVLEGCVYILSHIQEGGVIRKKGDVFSAVFGGDDGAAKKVASLFEEASLRYKIPSDIKTAVWKKYIFISAFAALTSYYDESIGSIYKNHYDEAKELLEEIADVASAKGVNIQDEVQKSLYTASKVPYDSTTSMQLDFKNLKKSELEILCGYIVKEALKKGINTPIMHKMYEELSKREVSRY